MEFEEILFSARQGEEKAIEQILVRNALVRGIFDEDLYQEPLIESLKCIQYFKMKE